MKAITLTGGEVLVEVCMKVTITKFELVAAACWAIHNKRRVKSKKHFVLLIRRLIESGGVESLVRYSNEYKSLAVSANKMVERLYPEIGGNSIQTSDKPNKKTNRCLCLV